MIWRCGGDGFDELAVRIAGRFARIEPRKRAWLFLLGLLAGLPVAGRRWTIEESFQAGKGLTGLDAHQVRRWTSWHRWTVLAMLARAFLAVTAAPGGDASTKREHATATTSVKRPNSPDHELLLEYYSRRRRVSSISAFRAFA